MLAAPNRRSAAGSVLLDHTQLQLRDLGLEKFLRGHSAPVQAVAYCSDLRYIASGASDGIVLVSQA